MHSSVKCLILCPPWHAHIHITHTHAHTLYMCTVTLHSITIQVYGDVSVRYCQFQDNQFWVRVIINLPENVCTDECSFIPQLGIALAARSSVYVCYLIIIVWYSWSVLRNTFLMCYMGISNAVSNTWLGIL